MNITCFSQRDQRWAADRLGEGKYIIGQSGCLITSIASVLVDFGVPTDPHRLNLWLQSNGGYHDGNLFVFDSVKGLGADLAELVYCPKVPAPVDVLAAALDAGAGVIVEVDYHPSGKVDQHWVRLVSLQASGGWIVDPWRLPGSEMVALDDYMIRGWTAARGIFAAAVYTHNGDRMVRFTCTEPREENVQKTVAVRTP